MSCAGVVTPQVWERGGLGGAQVSVDTQIKPTRRIKPGSRPCNQAGSHGAGRDPAVRSRPCFDRRLSHGTRESRLATRAPVNREPLTPFGLAPDEAEPLADSASGFQTGQRASGNTSNNRRAGGPRRWRGVTLA